MVHQYLIKITLRSLLVVLFLSLTACSADKNGNRLKIGDSAPLFQTQDINGQTVNLASFLNQPVVLRFFYPNCQYCRADTSIFNKYYEKYKSKGLHIIYLNTAPKSDDLRQFVDDLHIEFTVIWDAKMEIANKYRVKMVPQAIVLNPGHKIIAAILGGVSKEQLDNLLGKFLK
jgi:peroxiredoxin